MSPPAAAPDAPAGAPPLWRRFALGLCMFLITGSFGILQPFTPLYLAASGLNKGTIGLVSGLAAILASFSQPLWGRLSDRLDARRPVMVALALVAGAALFNYRAAQGWPGFLLLMTIAASGNQYLNLVGGVLVGRIASVRSGGAAYANYRFWGSVGYVLVTLVTGFLLPRPRVVTRETLDPVFVYGPALYGLIALAALAVPDRRGEGIVAGGTRSESAGDLPNLHRFLVALFLYQLALYGAVAFLPLYMTSLGGSPRWVTIMFAAGVVSEVLVMRWVGRWTDIHGRKPALALAMMVMPLRLLLYIPATGPLWVAAVQVIHGFNFGIVGTVAVAFVNDVAPAANRGASQARFAAVTGIGGALGPMLCGVIADAFGMRAMFAAMAALGAAGTAVLLLFVRESVPAPRRPFSKN